jgi:hypothetical protein
LVGLPLGDCFLHRSHRHLLLAIQTQKLGVTRSTDERAKLKDEPQRCSIPHDIFHLCPLSFETSPCVYQKVFVPLHSKSECGEIWLLATTIKNAKREGRLRTAPRLWSLRVQEGPAQSSTFCFRVIRRDGQIFFAHSLIT